VSDRHHPQRHPARLLALGGALLVIGLAIYTTARPTTPFGPSASDWRLFPSSSGALATLLGSAPTFVHVIAFTLMTASVVRHTGRDVLLIAGGWAAIEILFELLQLPSLGNWLLGHHTLRSLPFAASYLTGTFDPADIVAALLGAALSARFLTPPSTRTP
jgi:hypothetical protein